MLASSSPRRVQLMEELGVEFVVAEPTSDESSTDPDPCMRVIQNAEAKALSVSQLYPNSWIIGADTIVYIEGRFLGKPESPEDAKHMLKMLSGKTHHVYTGLAVLDSFSSAIISGFEETHVKFKKLSESTIEEYVNTGDPLDKAGAYGIQVIGEVFVEELKGSLSNVIGLPLELLWKILDKIGVCHLES